MNAAFLRRHLHFGAISCRSENILIYKRKILRENKNQEKRKKTRFRPRKKGINLNKQEKKMCLNLTFFILFSQLSWNTTKLKGTAFEKWPTSYFIFTENFVISFMNMLDLPFIFDLLVMNQYNCGCMLLGLVICSTNVHSPFHNPHSYQHLWWFFI